MVDGYGSEGAMGTGGIGLRSWGKAVVEGGGAGREGLRGPGGHDVDEKEVDVDDKAGRGGNEAVGVVDIPTLKGVAMDGRLITCVGVASVEALEAP